MTDKSTRGWTSKQTPIPGLHDHFGPTPGQASEGGASVGEGGSEPRTGGTTGPVTSTRDAARLARDYPPDLVFIVGADGTVLFVNRELPGVPQGDVLGTSIYRYIFPEQHDTVRGCLERVFASGEADGYECAGMRPHDAKSWYQCRVAPNLREGRVVSATIIARDVTHLKQIEDSLRKDREALERELEARQAELTEAQRAIAEQEARAAARRVDLARFRELMDQAGEAVFITDPESGRFVDVNETACRWLGQPREDLLSLSIRDVEVRFPLQGPEGSAEHVPDTRDANRPQVFDHGLHRRRDGSTFPVEVAIARRRFGDHEYILAVAREINSRKRTEAALREVENQFRNLMELSHDAVYLSARDGTVAEANDAAVALFGYDRDELIGMPAKRLYVRPDDIRRFQREVAERGRARDLEVELVSKNGTPFRGLLSATLRRGADGVILGYQCAIRADGWDETGPTAGARREGAQRGSERAVLLLEADAAARAEIAGVLERAGITVFAAGSNEEGAGVLQAHGPVIGAVVVGGDTVGQGWTCLHDAQRLRPEVPVLLVTDRPADEISPELSHLDVGEIAVTPLHPLTLVQRVRGALGSRD